MVSRSLLQVRSVGLEFAVFDKDTLHCCHGGFDLKIHRSKIGRLEDDLQRSRSLFRGCAQDAEVAFFDDAFGGQESIDDGKGVSREKLACGLKRWLKQVLTEQVSADETVAAIRSVVRVQGDDAIILLAPQFGLKIDDFGFDGARPELTVQIQSTVAVPRTEQPACGIARRIEVQFIIMKLLWTVRSPADQLLRGQRARFFITVNAGKDAKLHSLAGLERLANDLLDVDLVGCGRGIGHSSGTGQEVDAPAKSAAAGEAEIAGEIHDFKQRLGCVQFQPTRWKDSARPYCSRQ